MTTFTKAKPFEFEGLHVYREGLFGDISHHDTAATRFMDVKSNERIARAMHAFIEAERNEWHEDGTGFRKGRWIAIGKEDSWHVRHDDFEGSSWASYTGGGGAPFARDAAALLQDFLNWHEATYTKQPAEPTGLGAVVEVAVGKFILCDPLDDFPWRSAGLEGEWEDWPSLTDRGPVTVLSEGWTK